MNLCFSTIGRRGYIADYFRPHIGAGSRIVGTSNTAWTPGFDACDSGVLMPDIASDDYIPALVDLCRRESISGLLSFFDPDVVRLSKHLDLLRDAGVTPIIPAPEISEICFDKLKTARFLERQGFHTARTLTDLDAAITAIDRKDLHFPLIVKPRFGFGSANTFVARDPRQLEVFFGYAPDMIIQEQLLGDAYDVEICSDLEGRVLAVVPWRKFLSRLGETDRAMTTKDPLLLEEGQRLGEALGHVGPLDADLFLREGRISVLEINLRFGGGYPVSHLAGADFPRLVVRMLRGETCEPEIGHFREGVVMMKNLAVLGGPADEFFASLGVEPRPAPGSAPD